MKILCSKKELVITFVLSMILNSHTFNKTNYFDFVTTKYAVAKSIILSIFSQNQMSIWWMMYTSFGIQKFLTKITVCEKISVALFKLILLILLLPRNY